MSPDYNFNLNGKKIWVAGETGMVGRAIVKALKLENFKVISAPHSELDLTNQNDVREWFHENKPDVVIMTAGKVGGIGANQSAPADFLYQNAMMAQNVIHSAFQANVQKLVYLGSSCIYPKFAEQPIKEEALLTGALEPTNEGYALAKIMGVKLCQYYREQYGCDFISLMPTNLYGLHDHFDEENSHVIPALILKIHKAKIQNDAEVVLWGSGTPLREFLYVDDLAQAILLTIKKYSEARPLNVGSGEEISIADLAKKIKSVIGYEGNINFDPAMPDGTPRKLLDSSHIQALGWKAKTPLEEGLRQTYEGYLEKF